VVRLLGHPATAGGEHVNSLATGAAALVAFVVLTVLVALRVFDGADRAILDFVQLPHAYWLDLLGSLVTVFGQLEVTGTIALGVAIARLRARREDWWIPLLLGVFVVVELALKLTIPQAPPPAELARSIQLLPFIESPTAYAFPSGHVGRVAFLVAALRWPAGTATAVLLAVAVTRIYLAEHWPSEVAGGWLLGYGIAAVALGTQRPRILLPS
jgi:membrane-associated phospholipid phosphatase